MILWLILAVLTLLTVVMLLRPLFKGPQAMAARDAYDREVYRDQLAEVKREEARGLLAAAEARAAEREIARRLLAARPLLDDAPAAAPADGPREASAARARRWTALALAAALPLAALAIYLYVGTPDAPDFPFASRDKVMEAQGMPDINEAIPRLEARLKAKPDDLEGWVLLGRSYASLGRMAEAVEAYRHAVVLSNDDPDIVAGYAESKVLEGGGTVTAEARKLFEEVRAKDPKNVPARFYLALVKVQEGDVEAGVREWLVIQSEAAPDAAWLPELHGEIERVAQEYKLDLAKLAPPGAALVPPMAAAPAAGAGSTASAGAAPGPSAADVAAAQNMSDAQRQEMIRGMVERLAERLKQQPDDLAGWQRLARAYDVLGEKEKAADAQARVAKLEAAAKAPSVQAPPAAAAAAGAAPGPSAADVAAAQNMSDAQRQEMIRGMVERLAERLKQQPDDLAGWQRLARAYDVLGEKEKAADAQARVAKLEAAANAASAQAPPAAAAAAGAAPGPSAADVAAAQNMSDAQRQEMIRGMVERLAERLKQQPDDLAGWQRLARAYDVLGERDKATDALAQAAALAPKDPDVLVAYGNALLAQGNSSDDPPAKAAEVMRQVLAIDSARREALWVVGLADAAQGDKQTAAALWGRLLAELSPGTPEYLQVKGRLAALGPAQGQ